MSTTIKKFDYRVIKMKKVDTLPLDPYVEVVLAEEMKRQSGEMLVSSHLTSEAEIDRHIRDLKADLDSVGRKAKAALARARAETLDIVSLRNSS